MDQISAISALNHQYWVEMTLVKPNWLTNIIYNLKFVSNVLIWKNAEYVF